MDRGRHQNHPYAVAISLHTLHFYWIHKALRVTGAMEAGITDIHGRSRKYLIELGLLIRHIYGH